MLSVSNLPLRRSGAGLDTKLKVLCFFENIIIVVSCFRNTVLCCTVLYCTVLYHSSNPTLHPPTRGSSTESTCQRNAAPVARSAKSGERSADPTLPRPTGGRTEFDLLSLPTHKPCSTRRDFGEVAGRATCQTNNIRLCSRQHEVARARCTF